MTDTVMTSTAAPTATASTVPSMSLLPQYLTTAKGRPSNRPHLEPKALMSLALETGGIVDISNAQTLTELASRGLKPHRIPSAVWGAKHYFGATVKSMRTGRKVTSIEVKF